MNFTTNLIAALAALALVGKPMLDIVDRDAPATFYQFTIETPEVHPGESLIVRAFGVRHRNCPVTVTLKVADGAGYPFERELPGIFLPDHIEVEQPLSLVTSIPPGATPGRAWYTFYAVFVCNWTQRVWPITITSPRLEFVILPSPQTA